MGDDQGEETMTKQAIDALRLIHAEIDTVVRQLDADDWAKPSACEGWRVQDVLAHFSSNMKEAVDPTPPDADAPPPPDKAEEMVEVLISPRKDWTGAELVAEYDQYLEGWLGGLTAIQEEPMASTELALSDLGTYPMHLLANAFAFDHYCHLWIDLLGPDGPLDIEVAAPTDDMVRPGIDWMIAGVPRMQPAEMADAVTAPIQLELTGPGGGSWSITPAAAGELVGVTEEAGAAAVTVTSTAHDFVSWATQRSSWRDHCTVTGDEALATPFLDALNII